MSAFAPLISIIVPTYNCAEILRGCLDSLVDQKYPSIEIVIMDGRSSDDTVAVAQEYGKRISLIVSEPDKGIYDAMNKGIIASSGEWLLFMGADDTLVDANVLSDFMESEGASDDHTLMLYGDACGDLLGKKYPGEMTPQSLVGGNICHQSILYRRRLFEIEPSYDTRYRLYADWDLNLRVFLRHPGTATYVDRLVATFTGGLSTSRDDEIFWKERLHRIWDYAVKGYGEPFAKKILGPHYIAALNEARRRKQWSVFTALFIEAVRRSHLTNSVINYAYRRLRKKPLY